MSDKNISGFLFGADEGRTFQAPRSKGPRGGTPLGQFRKLKLPEEHRKRPGRRIVKAKSRTPFDDIFGLNSVRNFIF